MIQVDDLTVSFGFEPLFDKVTFSIQKGERLGFIGRNGSGKSTLFRVITGKESYDSGRIIIPKGYTIGYLDQHIVFSKPTVLEEACTTLKDSCEEYKAEIILLGLGFAEDDFHKAPTSFSGGYQLRLHLAKVLLSEPDCLFLDEPTNYLDIVSIHWLKEFLRDFDGEFICITHDREFMDSVTTHTMGLHRKKIKKVKGSSVDYFEQILIQEEVYEKTRQSLNKKIEHAQSYIERFGAKASKATQAQSRKKMIEKIPVLEKLNALTQLEFRFQEANFSGKKMLEMKDVNFAYVEGQTLINDFSFQIEKGERIAIIGKNGYGKSTLLRLMAKDLEASDGVIEYSEALQIGYFGQTHIAKLKDHLTIEDEIRLSNPQLNDQQIKSVCGVVLFSGDQMKKKISVLSGGERSRVLLGKILAKRCNFILLDEPTHHLDMESIEALLEAIDAFSGSIVIVTHSEEILKRIPLDRLIYCHLGYQEPFLGTYEEFVEKKPQAIDADLKKPVKETEKNLKTELLNQKFQTLKMIEAELKKEENAVVKLELELKRIEEDLAKQAEKGQNNNPSLTQKHQKTLEAIDSGFQRLETLNYRYLEEERRFNHKINQHS
jgi:ATP-binding cassette subfamily F protein 3